MDVISFDELKRLANVLKHGYDFVELHVSFFETAVVLPGHSRRVKAVNTLDGKLVTVVFRRLGAEGVSVISMRPASREERSAYGAR